MDWEVIRESLSVLYFSPFEDDLSLILWCAFLGMIGALIYLIYRRQTLGKAILSLQEKGCTTEEGAKTPQELGLSPKLFQGQGRLFGKIKREDGSFAYYLPDSCREKAAALLKAASSKPWVIALGILGMYFLVLIIYHILPDLLEWLA